MPDGVALFALYASREEFISLLKSARRSTSLDVDGYTITIPRICSRLAGRGQFEPYLHI